MADLTPAELAKLDQIHANISSKLAELISSAVDGIHAEGEAMTASALAGTAQGTDHNSVSALLAAALIRLARHQIADEKRKTKPEEHEGFIKCPDCAASWPTEDAPNSARFLFRRHYAETHTETTDD